MSSLGAPLTYDPHPEERPAGPRLEGSATEQTLRTRLFHDLVRGPSFETAAEPAPSEVEGRPPQDEVVVDWNIVKRRGHFPLPGSGKGKKA